MNFDGSSTRACATAEQFIDRVATKGVFANLPYRGGAPHASRVKRPIAHCPDQPRTSIVVTNLDVAMDVRDALGLARN